MKIAVSACLLGTRCRYDGGSKPCERVLALRGNHELVSVCPEVMAGLPIPHAANEIVCAEPLRVCDSAGADNTEAFVRGARRALARAQEAGCELAILKAKSPSCGTGRVYDGSFTGTLIQGDGVAARMFLDAGIPVVDEEHVPEGL